MKTLLFFMNLPVLFLMVHLPVFAADGNPPDYETLYFPTSANLNGGGGYTEANYVWVYTAAFAERFRMPKQWIDPALKGAEAIAYHRSRRPISLCTVKDGCGPSEEEVLQIFLPGTNNLPWPDATFNYAWSLNAYGQSWSYLKPRSASDIEHVRRNTPFLVPTDFLKGSHFGKPDKSTTSKYFERVTDYHRAIYPGLDFVSLMANGIGAQQQGDEGIITLKDETLGNKASAVETMISLPASFSHRIGIYQKTWEVMTADYAKICAQFTYPWPATRQYTLGSWQERASDRLPDYVDAYTLQGARQNRLKNGGQFSEDPNIWVYTTEFAKRFGMPLEWADDSLKGALAISYHKVNATRKKKSGLNWDTGPVVVDLYLPNDAGLPWIKNEQYRYRGYALDELATDFVTPKDKTDTAHYSADSIFGKTPSALLTQPKSTGDFRKSVPIYYPVFAFINGGRIHAGKSLPYQPIVQGSFHRNLFAGIDRLQIGASRFFVKEHQPRYVMPGYESPPEKGHLVFTWKDTDYRKYQTELYEKVDYLVEIPKSFFDRAQSYDKEWMKGNRRTFKACDSKTQPWPPLCKANQLSCEYLQNPLPNSWR